MHDPIFRVRVCLLGYLFTQPILQYSSGTCVTAWLVVYVCVCVCAVFRLEVPDGVGGIGISPIENYVGEKHE